MLCSIDPEKRVTYAPVIASFEQRVSVISGNQQQKFLCLVAKPPPFSHCSPHVGSLVSVLHGKLQPKDIPGPFL